MWYYVCLTCGTVVVISGSVEDHDRLFVRHQNWKKGCPCITFGCQGSLDRTLDIAWCVNQASRILRLSPQEFFRALCGGGTPEEVLCSPEVVRAFLLSSRIVKVDLRQEMGSDRTFIDRIYLENETVLHLGGAAGAMVYKVTKNAKERDQVGVLSSAEDPALRRPGGVIRGGTEWEVGNQDPAGLPPGTPDGSDVGRSSLMAETLPGYGNNGGPDPAGE